MFLFASLRRVWRFVAHTMKSQVRVKPSQSVSVSLSFSLSIYLAYVSLSFSPSLVLIAVLLGEKIAHYRMFALCVTGSEEFRQHPNALTRCMTQFVWSA